MFDNNGTNNAQWNTQNAYNVLNIVNKQYYRNMEDSQQDTNLYINTWHCWLLRNHLACDNRKKL